MLTVAASELDKLGMWHMRERTGAHRVSMGKPLGKKPRHGCEDNIKIDLQEIGLGGGRGGKNWIELAQDSNRWKALVNATINLRIS
jgi:hypothetical protein